VVAGRGGLGQSKLRKTIPDGAAVLIQVVSTTGACASGPGCAGDDHSRVINDVAELLGDTKRVAADHYIYALTDYREVDRTIALARSMSVA
jgi:hypothetical protein